MNVFYAPLAYVTQLIRVLIKIVNIVDWDMRKEKIIEFIAFLIFGPVILGFAVFFDIITFMHNIYKEEVTDYNKNLDKQISPDGHMMLEYTCDVSLTKLRRNVR